MNHHLAPSARMNRPAHLLLPVALALLSVTTLWPGFAGAQPAASAPAARPALTIQTVQPQAQQWAQALAATGTVAAWQEVVVGAELGGLRIQELLVRVGDRVRRGQLLVRLSPGTLESDLAASRAGLLEAQVAARDAQAQAERVRPLRGTEALAEQQIDATLAAAQTAQARVAALQARLKADEQRLAYTRITAPDDGVVSKVDAVQGALAAAGGELLRLQRGGRLEWRAEVPAAELPRVAAGQAVRLQPSGAAPVQGRVRQVAPTVDAATRNGLVYVDLPAAPQLRAGQFARGELLLAEQAVLTLPQTAVLVRDGFAYVFRLDKTQVRQQKVVLGARQGDRVAVVSGLAAGAAVAAAGVGFLADGDTVRVVPGAPAAAGAAAKTTPPAAPSGAAPAAPAPPAPVVQR